MPIGNSMKPTVELIQGIIAHDSQKVPNHTGRIGTSTYPFLWFISERVASPDPDVARGMVVTERGMVFSPPDSMEREVLSEEEAKVRLGVGEGEPIRSDVAFEAMRSITEYGVCCLHEDSTFAFYVDCCSSSNGLVLKKVVFKEPESLEAVEEYAYTPTILLRSIADEDGTPIGIPAPIDGRFRLGRRLKNANREAVNSVERPFIQKYGHTEIVIANEQGASGTGQLSTDGFSIGYSATIRLGEGKTARLKLRGNIPLSIPSVPPAITVSVESDLPLEMEVLCDTTDPSLSDAPKAVLRVKPNQRNEARFEVGKVTTHNTPDEEAKRPTIQTEPIQQAKDDVTVESSTGRLRPFPPIAETNLRGEEQNNLWVLSNHSIGYLTHTNPKEQVMGQVWIAIATKGSEKVEGKDYWYLIGGEDEDPPYRGIDLVDVKALRPGARVYEDAKSKEAIVDVSIDGAILPLGLYYRVQVTSLMGTKKPMVKVDLMGVKGFNGYLDIVSDIAFDFYQDGPIEVDLPPNKRFSFSGK